jgi:hypothetical protein
MLAVTGNATIALLAVLVLLIAEIYLLYLFDVRNRTSQICRRKLEAILDDLQNRHPVDDDGNLILNRDQEENSFKLREPLPPVSPHATSPHRSSPTE